VGDLTGWTTRPGHTGSWYLAFSAGGESPRVEGVITSITRATTPVNLAPATAGELVPGQSYNETRAVDVTVQANYPLIVSSMTLDGLRFSEIAESVLVGARIYDSEGTVVAAANTNIQAPGQVTIPISAVLNPGSTYRVGFYVLTTPSDLASGTLLRRTGATLEEFPAYDGVPGDLRVIAAWSGREDAYPTNRNVAVPQITIAVSR
jgi:hypothetical protein